MKPADLPGWLDRFLCRIRLGCYACGWWRWDRPCYSYDHFKVWQFALFLTVFVVPLLSLAVAVVFS